MPLVLVNLFHSSASYRSLMHHYSLHLAVTAVVMPSTPTSDPR